MFFVQKYRRIERNCFHSFVSSFQPVSFYLFFTVIIVRLKQHLSIYMQNNLEVTFSIECLEHETMYLEMNLKLLYLRMKKQKKRWFLLFHHWWLICSDLCWKILLKNVEMRINFSQLLKKFLEKSREIEAKCKNWVRPGNNRNDFTIRLNKQRKVFNYSVEIFIKNFSHYFTLFFGTKFFRCLRKLEKSGRGEDTRIQHYFIRIENLTTQI